MNQPFNDLESVIIVIGISEPIRARYIGKSKDNYLFERLKIDFGQFKGGGQLIPMRNFHFASDKIMGRRVVVMD